jgi:4,5-DOPA dioxygenase extradiol
MKRSKFLKIMATVPLVAPALRLLDFEKATRDLPNTDKMPVLFIGHGAWTVLQHMFPDADIPVFQMSIDYSQPAEYHYKLGQALQKMREKGVLILSSGNIVHNLGMLNWREMEAKPHDWAVEFDDMVKKCLDDRNFEELIYYRRLGNAATMSVPSNDHYLPMMYTLGLAQEKDELKYTFEGLFKLAE